jgi:hypothetical protein
MVTWSHVLGQNITVMEVCGRGASSPHGNRRRGIRRDWGQGITFKDTYSNDLLPSVRPHLLKFPPLPKIVPSAGDPAFNT